MIRIRSSERAERDRGEAILVRRKRADAQQYLSGADDGKGGGSVGRLKRRRLEIRKDAKVGVFG